MKQVWLEFESDRRVEQPYVLQESERRQLVALMAAAIVAVLRESGEVRDDNASIPT